MSYRTFQEVVRDAPDWWPAWTDYPHGSLTEKQARELSAYTTRLQGALMDLLPGRAKAGQPPAPQEDECSDSPKGKHCNADGIEHDHCNACCHCEKVCDAATPAYRIEVEKDGCSMCGHERQWAIVGPDETALSISFEDQEHAEWIAENMSDAYAAARTELPRALKTIRVLAEALREMRCRCVYEWSAICEVCDGPLTLGVEQFDDSWICGHCKATRNGRRTLTKPCSRCRVLADLDAKETPDA